MEVYLLLLVSGYAKPIPNFLLPLNVRPKDFFTLPTYSLLPTSFLFADTNQNCFGGVPKLSLGQWPICSTKTQETFSA